MPVSKQKPTTLQKSSPRCLSPRRAPTRWAKWPKRYWESLPVLARSVASTKCSPSNLRLGDSVLFSNTGVSCTWMACILAFVPVCCIPPMIVCSGEQTQKPWIHTISQREMHLLPVVGGIAIWVGILPRRRQEL
jgi:hypothetical protein